MNRLIIFSSCLLLLAGCKSKKLKPEVPATDFFPVKTYLQGQLAQLDTSSLQFYKVETAEGRSDTMRITNKDVKNYATDFAALPDISAPDTKNDYAVDHLYDDLLEAFVFTFTTKEDHPVKREDVVLEPQLNAQGKNDIKSVFVQLDEKRNDTAIQKNLLWEANKNFRVTITAEPPGKPAQIKTVQVFWDGFTGKNK